MQNSFVFMPSNQDLLDLVDENIPVDAPDESQIIDAAAINATFKAIINEMAARLPAGGTEGQILAKDSGTDYDTAWIDAPTGGGGGEDELTFHFEGNWPSGTLPTEEEIEAMTSQAIPSGGAKIIQFTNPVTDQYKVFAYPSTEADPTTYYIGPLDNGTLGSGGTFAAPVTVGAYRVIISNYATTIPDPVTFS